MSFPIRPRPFYLKRIEDITGVSGPGKVADGVEFDDGVAILHWKTKVASTEIWPTVADVEMIHGHDGRTIVVYYDTEENKKLANWADDVERCDYQ